MARRVVRLKRRSLLKLGGALVAAGAPFIHLPGRAFAQVPDGEVEDEAGNEVSDEITVQPAPRPFGRAIQGGLIVRDAPSLKANVVRNLGLNEVVALTGQTTGDSPAAHNVIWYQTTDGFVYSAFMQPCENNVNAPIGQVDPNTLLWGEVTVPVSEARAQPAAQAGIRYRFYYSCIVQVLAVVGDQDGTPWYQVSDGFYNGLFVRAEHIRPVSPDELTPISPDVPPEAKRIEVDLAQQMVTAYEEDRPVFSARVATGYGGFRTIPGEHRIFQKTPSRRMIGGARGTSDYYDLPGIGWVSYFTASRIAFHSTYWHNDYGRPRSHGCVNMLPEDAKWVFRWTTPRTPYEERWTNTAAASEGSLVKVF